MTSKDVVVACLERIEATNGALNAVVQLAPGAIAAAEEADQAVACGEVNGPLHGVPITVKDNIDVAGLPTSMGTTGRAAFVPPHDATVVRRLREAGAIVLGKTNMPELGLAPETDNLVYGRTNNPYALERTSGGRSGGEAAVVAVGGSPLNLTGWPAVTVPAGTSADGLPIGVQIIAPPWRDDVCLAIARRIELVCGGWRPPPPNAEMGLASGIDSHE